MKLEWSLLAALAFGLSACGVKGDPVPPEQPPVIGRGQPTYKKATEKLALPPFEEEDQLEPAEDAEE